jgi:YkoY family integral membrane protein
MLEKLAEYAGESLSLNIFGLLLALVAMETVLSADNAVALATLVQDLENREHQRQALNWGLIVALLLRVSLLLTATWVIQFWQFELLGAIYLLWLSTKYFWERFSSSEVDSQIGNRPTQGLNSFWQVVPLIAMTDLAFSMDSVTTAVALTNRTWLVLIGCLMGVISLRFLSGLFVRLLERFTYLEVAAYLSVLAVGMRLLFKVIFPSYVPPDWFVLTLMAVLFTWGFSKRVVPQVLEKERKTIELTPGTEIKVARYSQLEEVYCQNASHYRKPNPYSVEKKHDF